MVSLSNGMDTCCKDVILYEMYYNSYVKGLSIWKQRGYTYMLKSFLFALKPTGGSLPVIMLALTCEM